MKINWDVKTRIEKWETTESFLKEPPKEVYFGQDNLLVNDGINLLLDLFIGVGGTPYDESVSRVGVGNGTSTATETQTELQGSQTFFQDVEEGYPQRTGQVVAFRAVYGEEDANFSWQEWGIDNSTTLLNRKVQNMGEKDGGTWALNVEITLSSED